MRKRLTATLGVTCGLCLALGSGFMTALARPIPGANHGDSWAMIAVGGLLVGFGTRLGSGCASGHGVCGLARLSRRSLAAVATFLSTGIVTAVSVHALLY